MSIFEEILSEMKSFKYEMIRFKEISNEVKRLKSEMTRSSVYERGHKISHPFSLRCCFTLIAMQAQALSVETHYLKVSSVLVTLLQFLL